MEATGEDLNLLQKLRPPRIEDAGLEDCALPPDSIQEAFLKAATAVGSRAANIFAGDQDSSDGGCVSDPWPEKHVPSDKLVGVEPESSPPEPCATGKGVAAVGGGASATDVVVVGKGKEDDGEKKDKVGGEGGDCVDGLKGLGIKEKEKSEKEEEREKKPTLVEGYFFNP